MVLIIFKHLSYVIRLFFVENTFYVLTNFIV